MNKNTRTSRRYLQIVHLNQLQNKCVAVDQSIHRALLFIIRLSNNIHFLKMLRLQSPPVLAIGINAFHFLINLLYLKL